LLPEDKVRLVEDLGHRFGAVAMVGDGVNDARPWQPPASASPRGRWVQTPRSRPPISR
jgi:hypothetical protein